MKQAAHDTATKHDIAMLKAQEGLESVSSEIDVLKQKVEENTASKEDITRLEKKIEELKNVQEERDYQPINSGKKFWIIVDSKRETPKIQDSWKPVSIGFGKLNVNQELQDE